MRTTRAFIVAALTITGSAFAQNADLRVVVIEGEDAVNIIQQKTAVRPIVEVRDRNNLPVSGALVTFSIEGGKAATFGGASTLTVATNAAGQAAVTGLTPSAAGAFQIQVSAAFQGQVATATIAQTNVMTAAQAAAASAASSSGGTAAGGGAAAGGAGGGVSATTIGLVGAAVGGGALAVTQVAGKQEPEATTGDRFTGSIGGSMNETVTGVVGFSCSFNHNIIATITLTLDVNTATTVSGKMRAQGTKTIVASTCALPPITTTTFDEEFTVSGTQASFGFRDTQTETQTAANDPRIVRQSTTNSALEATLSGNVVNGTLKIEEQSTTTGAEGGPINSTSSGTFPLTLNRS